MKYRVSYLLIPVIVVILLSSLIACNSGVDMKQVENSFSQFLKFAKEKNIDAAWDKCYEPAFLGEGEIEFMIESYYSQIFEKYDYFVVADSDSGEIDDFTGEMYPELSGKTAANMRGYLYYTDGTKLLFEALLVKVNDVWKIASFNIPDVDTFSNTQEQNEVPIETKFIIDDMKLCSDLQDTSHFTINQDSSYIQGQAIYLLFNIHGVMSKRIDDHYEINMKFSRFALLNDKGEEVANQNDFEFNEAHLSNDDYLSFPMWLKAGVPLDAPSGDYTMELEVTDLFANDTVATVIPLIIEESAITTNNAHLCAEIDEFGDYVLQPNNTYKQGDSVYIYIETPGSSTNLVDGQNTIWLRCSKYTVYDPRGTAIIDIKDALSEKIPYDDPFVAPYMDFDFDIPIDSEIGQWSFEIIIEDGWTGDTATKTLYFDVEDDGSNQEIVS